MRDDDRQPVVTNDRPASWLGLVAVCSVLYLAWGLIALGRLWERLDATGLSLGIVLSLTGALLLAASRLIRRSWATVTLLPVMGLIDLVAGIALLVTAVRWVAPLAMVVGLWSIVRGIVDGIGALDMRRSGVRRWRVWFVGAVASMAFGFFVLAGGLAAAVDVTAWIAIAVLAIGAATLALTWVAGRLLQQPASRREPPDEQQRAA